MQKNDIKFFEQERDSQPLVPSSVKTEFGQEYRKILSGAIDISEESQLIFRKNKISFDPQSFYESFSFEVQKPFQSFPFYRVLVRIAHFSLVVNVVKCKDSDFVMGDYGQSNDFPNIRFLKIQTLEICVKRTSFRNEQHFQQIFAKAVKEWTILKICSALGCGPFTMNYFGFDIVILEDSVQFACQKCLSNSKISPEQQTQLKMALSLMHSFKIIHFDIKPENIAFSPHFGKAVFIDFGLSEIVKEDLGYKTFSSFKGTPNFSSPQVLLIMFEPPQYVDLYYNDAFGLKLIVNMQNQRKLEEKCQSQYKTQAQQQLISMIQSESMKTIQLNLWLLSFQYHYLDRNQLKSRQILRLLLITSEKIIQNILIFIKSIIKEVFIVSLFKEDLKAYTERSVYQQIQINTKENLQKLYVQPINYKKQNEDEDDKYTSNRIEPVSFKKSFVPTQNFAQLIKVMMRLQELKEQEAQLFLAVSFESIRFDKRNLQFQEKCLISNKMVPFLSKLVRTQRCQLSVSGIDSKSQKQPNSIEMVKRFISLLLEYCLSSCKSEKWVKDRLFDVFQQSILLNVGLAASIEPFLMYVDKNFTTAFEHITAALQCARLSSSIQMIKVSNLEQTIRIQQKLVYFAKFQTQKFRKKTSESSDLQILSITNIINILERKKPQIKSIEQIQKWLSDIKNSMIRGYLMYNLAQEKTQFILNSLNCKNTLKLIDQLKSSELQKLDFLSFVRLTTKIVQFTGSSSDMAAHTSFIKSVINCSEVAKLLHIATLAQPKPSNFMQINERIDTFLKDFSYQQSKSSKLIQFQLMLIINQIQANNIKIDFPLHSKMLLLFQIYKKISKQNQTCILQQTKDYLQVFYKIQIEFFFFKLGESTQQIFLSNLSQSKADFQRYNQQPMKNYKKFALLYLRSTQYTCKYYAFKGLYKQCLILYEQLIKFSLKTDMWFLALQIFVQHSGVSKVWGKDEYTYTSALLIYNYCKSKQQYSFFLLSRGLSFSFDALKVFAKYDEPILHEWLLNLTNFAFENPLQSYICSLISLCDRFLNSYPHYHKAFHYKKVTLNQAVTLKTNSYLLIFYVYTLFVETGEAQTKLFKNVAKNIDQLCESAKKLILGKYFIAFLLSMKKIAIRRKWSIFRYAKHYINLRRRDFVKTILKVKVASELLGLKQNLIRQKTLLFVNNL